MLSESRPEGASSWPPAGQLPGIKKEIFRYLGYRKTQPEPAVEEAVAEELNHLLPLLTPREVHRVFPLRRTGAENLQLEGMDIRSHALARNLAGCREVCLMAATVGFGPDRLAARAQAGGKTSRAVILQAAGAALIEAWCGRVNEIIREEASAKGLFLRPRFSPGYGDFLLEHQTQLFQILNVSKTIGVTLSESLLMMPTKSVTALIGLSETDEHCSPQGCENCSRAQTCAFRRM